MWKPAYVHLRLTTFRVEGNDLDVERVLEIRFSRIVKSQMSVFPDPQQAELRVELPQQVSVFPAGLFRIGAGAVNAVKLTHLHLAREPFAQVTPERCRVVVRNAKILVHMKSYNLVPGQSRNGGQGL